MKAQEPESTPPPPSGDEQTRRIGPAEGSLTVLARVLDQYLVDLQAGRQPDRARLLAEHPDLASQLEQALDGLEFIHRASTDDAPPPARLGDFRIVREVGRGGMGVVYEAEQISLRRRVALKVLRFGAVADEVAMQRFQREAETVAQLHHTNIVPIFAVGSEEGVRYYAMQFIEGRDLADLASQARQGEPSISPVDVARWGLQAADALAHAHQHGVVHRDIKPSNLILDRDGRIWLTDFGLARRVDDVALSVAGALLGTPRYMSPEQARASKDPIDHRTDIYSLGATLYELATGQPIFEATTPHEVLTQILNAEPRAPRQLSPQVPRDLETIILKCLAKEPAQRYPTALALADDLRAFLEGRAISARPPNLLERGARWMRKHRRTSTVAAFSAGVSLVLAIGGYLFWQDRQQARLGRLELATDTPNLLAEVIDANGRALTPVFPVPTPAPVALPAGSHQLRLSASGLLSETWPIEITRRQTETRFVQLSSQWLWPPGEVNTTEYPETEVVTLGPRADLLVLAHASSDQTGTHNTRRMRRLDGLTGKPAWPHDLVFDETSVPPQGNLDEWKTLLSPAGLTSIWKDNGLAGRIGDLNGDGMGDPVLLSRNTPSLLAVSGASGRVLWWARVRPVLGESVGQQANPTNGMKLDRSGRGFVVGLPAMADVDGDSTPDFIACFYSEGDTYVTPDGARHRTGAQSWLSAISGKTGAVLWRKPVKENWEFYLNSSIEAEKYHPLCRPALGRVGGHEVVVLVAKSRLLGFNARTGEAAWAPVSLGFEPDQAPTVADFDGDGQSEAVFLRLSEDADAIRSLHSVKAHDSFAEETALCAMAVSLPDGAVRWEKAFSLSPKWQAHELKNRRRQFHVVSDLDGDGRPEIILSGGQRSLRGGTRMSMQVLDGKSGSNRWHRLLWAQEFFGGAWNVDQFTVGPDLDGDGHRELLAAWEGFDASRGKHGLFAAALSGANGATLWRTHHPGVGSPNALAWWHAGADGRPLLLVSAGRSSGGQVMTLALAASSGKVEHTLPDVRESRVADFDGDGILDLYYTVSPQGAPRNLVIKGTAPDAWRQLGDWRAAADFDADGFTDLVGIFDGVLSARSGRDGHRLWQARKGPRDSPMESPQPMGDLDGDGVADVLATVNVWREIRPNAYTTKRLAAAFSGKDGHQLWLAEDLDIFGGSASGSGPNWSYLYPQLTWAGPGADGTAQLFAMRAPLGNSLILSAVAGRDGRVLWSVPTARGSFGLSPSPAGLPLADFNSDGVRDVALWSPFDTNAGEQGPLQLNAFDGRTGKPLWTAPEVDVSQPGRLIWPEPAVADLDGDGVAEVIVTRHSGYDQRRGLYRCELVVADGRDGHVRWTWNWQAGFPQMWPPVVLKAKGRPHSVCLVVQTNSISTLVALDINGREQTRRTLSLPGGQFESGRFVWRATDVNSDEQDDLLLVDAGQLCALGGDKLGVLWRWQLPDDAVRLADVRASAPGQPATLTVWAGRDVYGVDGASGQSLWRCNVAATPRSGNPDAPEVRRLEAGIASSLPRVQHLAAIRSVNNRPSVVRQCWPVGAAGKYLAPALQPQAYKPLADVTPPKRRLPWAQTAQTSLVFSGAITLLVAGIPLALVWWAIRRRSWLLGLWPLCYAGLSLLLPWRAAIPALIVLGYAGWLGVSAGRSRRLPLIPVALVYAVLALAVLMGSLVPSSAHEISNWNQRWPIILFGVPATAFWVMCGLAIWNKHWSALRRLLSSVIVAAVLVAVFWLLVDRNERNLDEAYSWQEWHGIMFIGASIGGLMGLFVVARRKLKDRWRRRRSRNSVDATPA